MRIREDVINSQLIFDPNDNEYAKDKAIEVVDNALAAKVSGAEYSIAFRRGVWDGKHHFLKQNKREGTFTFPTGLVSQVSQALSEEDIIGLSFEIDDVRPDFFVDYDKVPDKLTLGDKDGGDSFILRPTQVKAVKSFLKQGVGIVNYSVASGKTAIGASVIKQVLPYLDKGDRIAFFAGTKDIFDQTVESLKTFLHTDKIGELGGGKHHLEQITVCTPATVNIMLKADPEVKLTQTKESRVNKKIKYKYYDKFRVKEHPKEALAGFLALAEPKTKADGYLLDTLQEVLDNSANDEMVILQLKAHVKEYDNYVRSMHKEAYDKYKYIHDFLDSVVLLVADECHHSKAETWYNIFMKCNNAIYRLGLSGSINPQDFEINEALSGIFGGIVAKQTAKQTSDLGYIAKPMITIIPINTPTDIGAIGEWPEVYKEGIVENKARNEQIAALAKGLYNKGKTVLIIVSQLKHCDNIKEILDKASVPCAIINGQEDSKTRGIYKEALKDGKLRVAIATSIFDEGTDIPGINSLILGGGGKSYRVTIQRVGRALRKVNKDDNVAYVYDFMDYQHRMLLKQSKARLRIYEEQEFDTRILNN